MASHEYMDLGSLTEDAIPEPGEQGPIEAPGSPAKDQEPSPVTPATPMSS